MTSSPALLDIVPEYRSRNPLVRWLFLERLEVALRLGRLDGGTPLRLADVGCGEGLFLRRLREAYPQHAATGVDHNEHVASLDVPGARVLRADITRPGQLPAAFDRVFCLDVLEHIRDLSGPLSQIRESLSAGGILVISAPAENLFHKTCRFLIKGTFSEVEGPCSSPHYHRAATLARDIPAAGFELLEAVSLPLPGPFALLNLYAFRRTA
jgi:SAM-dependent methyltransferase